jgi:putative DNA primase/helicase
MRAEDINRIVLGQIDAFLAEWLPGGRVENSEYVVRNPTRADNKPGSFRINLNKGVWADFATSDSGSDPISLYAYIKGISQGEAIKALKDRLGGASPAPAKPRPAQQAKITEMIPAPVGVRPNFRHPKHGAPSMTWVYKSRDGQAIGFVARYDTAEGKEICPMVFDQAQGRWRFAGFPDPRPLYGLEYLDKYDTALIVEGEKTADAAREILGPASRMIAISWQGGDKSVKRTDWAPLHGKRVAIFPDADEPGQVAAEKIAELLAAHCERVVIITPPPGVEKGWDLADGRLEGWDKDRLLAWIKNNQREIPRPKPEAALAVQKPAPKEKTAAPSNQYFQAYGFDGSNYIYYSYMKNQLVSLSPGEHSRKNLIELAPISYWEHEYGVKKDYDTVAEALMFQCMSKGPFTYDKVRGRGAWMEGGTPVIHLGDRLVVSGSEKSFQEYRSRFIYERSIALDDEGLPASASVEECRKFLAVCKRLNWEKSIYAELLAGWVVVSLVAGVLKWRPHLWVTGTAGTGKSWVLDNIVKLILGDVCLFVQSSATEAGLRQELRGDSLPVIFDEAEGGKNNADRISKIMELVRAASANNGAKIIKGSSSGEASKYLIRSCFCFASISNGVKEHADKSRVAVLALKEGSDQEHWKETRRLYGEAVTPEFARKLRSRAYSLAGVIRASADVIAEEAAKESGSRRIGDQIGSLFAGVWALMSDQVITPAQANEMLMKHDLSDFMDVKDEKDEIQCMRYLLQRMIKVTRNVGGAVEIPLGDALVIACHLGEGECVDSEARRALGHYGIKINNDRTEVYIARKHAQLAKIFEGTNWQAWDMTLKRLKDAQGGQPRDFQGTMIRTITIPLKTIMQLGDA